MLRSWLTTIFELCTSVTEPARTGQETSDERAERFESGDRETKLFQATCGRISRVRAARCQKLSLGSVAVVDQ